MPAYSDFHVRVTPSASKEYVKKGKSGKIEISVREVAKQGQANRQVRELVSQFFSVPLKNVTIIRGAHSSGKIIRVYAP